MTMEGGLSCQTNLQKSTRVFGRGPVTQCLGEVCLLHTSVLVCVLSVCLFLWEGVLYTLYTCMFVVSCVCKVCVYKLVVNLVLQETCLTHYIPTIDERL